MKAMVLPKWGQRGKSQGPLHQLQGVKQRCRALDSEPFEFASWLVGSLGRASRCGLVEGVSPGLDLASASL